MKDIQIAASVFNRPWAILPDTLSAVAALARRWMAGRWCDENDILAVSTKRIAPIKGRVTVLPLHGIMDYRAGGFLELFGGISTERFGQWFDEAVADPAVGAVVLDVDSPGGTVDGLRELSDKIRTARGVKPIYAVANSMAASAGYYAASAAEQLWVTPSGTVGSIGTVAEHLDFSKALEMEGIKPTFITSVPFKVEGNFMEPLGDEARAEVQKAVDQYGDQFEADVAKNRGVSKAAVKSDFGQGRMFLAEEAKDRGMVDKVGTLQELLTKLGATGRDPSVLQKRAQARAREFLKSHA